MKPLLFVVPVVIVATVAGLGLTGKINIPGLSPKPPVKSAPKGSDQIKAGKLVASNDQSKTKPTSAPIKADETKKPKANSKITKDPEQGADALATVWNEIDTPELIAISRNWKDDELVRVLTHMDNDKVAKFIDELAKGDPDSNVKGDPLRASKVSKALQDLGSIVKPAS